MSRSPSALFFLVILTVGCGPDPIEDVLDLTVPPYSVPVSIDSFCDNGGCAGQDDLTIILSFKDDAFLPEDAQVEFQQYRIDYHLNGITADVPFYAGLLNVVVYPGSTTSFAIATAGYTQRKFVRKKKNGERVKGTAHLTLAGYDQTDEQIFFDSVFAVEFDDFVVIPVVPPEEENPEE